MFTSVLIAMVLTFSIFMTVEFIKSVKQFLIFKQVRETILMVVFSYLKQTPQTFVDLVKLRELLLRKLNEIRLTRWVYDLKVTWSSYDAIQFVIELKFKEMKQKYKFVIGLKDIQEVINKANS